MNPAVSSCYLNGVDGGPEHWVVVLDCPPVLWPVGIGQVTAILFQDIQCCGKPLEGSQCLAGAQEGGDTIRER